MGERFYIKSAPADNERQFSARVNFVERAKRQATKCFRVHFFVDRHRAD